MDRLIGLQQARLHAAQALLKRYRTKEPRIQYSLGQRVWLEGKNLPFNVPSRKLAPKRYGPFKITQKISGVAYRLELPTYLKVHNVFHIDLLTPYKETEQYGPSFSPPPPDLIDGEEEQEIEAILDMRQRGNTRQYLIKWKGFPSSENEWVDSTHMNANNLVKKFHNSRLTRYKKTTK